MFIKKFGVILITIMLSACVNPQYANLAQNNNKINLIPMYGEGNPQYNKTEYLKKGDEKFIKSEIERTGSREKSSIEFAYEGWRQFGAGDPAVAMRRFNQSWLLNPNNYMPYWGFGTLLLKKNTAAEAVTHLEKALTLMDKDFSEKPRLLSTLARAFSIQGAAATDKVKKGKFFEKANSLFGESIKLDSQFGYALRYWALSSYSEGNYEKTWDMVKKLRGLGGRDLPTSSFIDALSKKMPEPK